MESLAKQHQGVQITLKTLTPIWTGGVETGKMDRLHETGLIGSLRWWYEAIVRGLGGRACDPSKHSCIYDPGKPNNDLCDVCQLFGATGWRRRFQLVVKDAPLSDPYPPIPNSMEANRLYKKTHKKKEIEITPTWYFPNQPKTGSFTIKLQKLDPHFSLELIQGLIQLAVDWTALGARPQMGFGVTELIGERLPTYPFKELQFSGTNSNSHFPSLQNMFFARIQKEDATDQDTFNLKYDLRRLFANDKNVRHFVMGTVKGNRMAAKIHMSRPYADGIIRVWGWVPKKAGVWNNAWNRDSVLDQIKRHLEDKDKDKDKDKGKDKYTLVTWREFSSSRDTLKKYNDPQAFLHSLWEGTK